MSFPKPSEIELPLLQEIKDAGGKESPRHLYSRLTRYFPKIAEGLEEEEKWKIRVRKAKQSLVQKGELEGTPGLWKLTEKGRERVIKEELRLDFLYPQPPPSPSHEELKQKLVEIGKLLGKYAVAEYQRYDVVWKESEFSPRLSHVFEVQDKGNLSAALARLKHAYDLQRSKPFIVITTEKERRKAEELLRPFLSGYFHELSRVIVILTPEDVEKILRALLPLGEVLKKLLQE